MNLKFLFESMATIKFIGTSAAIPSLKRGFSCIGLKPSNSLTVLLDCGDGSVRRIIQSGENLEDISEILITHFHSDHLSGLTQIIETMGIEKRERKLIVFGPSGLQEYFAQVSKTTNVASKRKFELELREVAPDQSLSVMGKSGNVRTFRMDHTIPCIGYSLNLDQKIISYTGDTVPCPGSLELARDADLLIHEATFLRKDASKAIEAKHSLPGEAAETARVAGTKELVLTHISDTHETEAEVQAESSSIFHEVQVARDDLEVKL